MKTEIELSNGQIAECSLGMAALKNLRHKDKALYELANRIICKGTDTIEEVSEALYASYIALCKDAVPMAKEEFINSLPDSYSEQVEYLKKII